MALLSTTTQLKLEIVRYYDEIVNEIDLQTEYSIIHVIHQGDGLFDHEQLIDKINQRRMRQIEYLRSNERACLFKLSKTAAGGERRPPRRLELCKSFYFTAKRSNQVYLVEANKLMKKEYVDLYRQVIEREDDDKNKKKKCGETSNDEFKRLDEMINFYGSMTFHVNGGVFTSLKSEIESERAKFPIDDENVFIVQLNTEQSFLLQLVHFFLVNYDQIKEKISSSQ